MNILLLNGSPRPKGNTRSLLERLTTRLVQQGHQVELLTVSSLNLSNCLACDGCAKNGGHCVRPDDTDAAMDKVAQADAVVFATPVYFWGITAQLKLLLDKFYSRDTQFMEMHKRMGLLTVGGAELTDPQYRLIQEQFTCIADYLHWDLRFSVSFSASDPGEVLTQPDVDQKLDEACRALT